jgi:hypothetical protein
LKADVRETHREEIISYLKQDCVGLYDGLTEFFQRYGCKITLASTAFEVGNKQFGVKPVKTGFHYDEQFRPYYFAGRVQFWSLGKHGETDGLERYKIVDINSAFPAAMLKRHWFGSDYVRRDTIPDENKEQCFYDITCDSDGVLPVRKVDGGVDFPVFKNRRLPVTGWELFAGIELGKVRNIVYHTIYEPKTLQDFAPYVNHFYELKKNAANLWDREFAKLFLNSCSPYAATGERKLAAIKNLITENLLSTLVNFVT